MSLPKEWIEAAELGCKKYWEDANATPSKSNGGISKYIAEALWSLLLEGGSEPQRYNSVEGSMDSDGSLVSLKDYQALEARLAEYDIIRSYVNTGNPTGHKWLGQHVAHALVESHREIKAQLAEKDQEIERLRTRDGKWQEALNEANTRAQHWCDNDVKKHGEIQVLLRELKNMEENRDAYAKAMAIAMEDGVFAEKEKTKAKIWEVLNLSEALKERE